jgi:16S rRNA (cytosine967-C5)-methyltransferase
MAVPPLDIAVKNDAAFWAETLGGQVLTSHIVRCPPLGDIRAISGYDEGAWWIQDAAAALPSEMLIASQGGSLSNKTVLDLCAAPGGKTAQLAAAGARVCAVEKDPDRLALLHDNLARLSLSAEVVEADILDYTPPYQSDFIILDAPCSATGTFRRHPDIFLHKKAPDLMRLQQTQIALLKRSLNWVVNDGALFYVTCSLQPEEGEEVIETILATGQARLLPFTETELGIFSAASHPKGWARILPSCLDHISSDSANASTGCDGFFVARLQPVRS